MNSQIQGLTVRLKKLQAELLDLCSTDAYDPETAEHLGEQIRLLRQEIDQLQLQQTSQLAGLCK